MIGRTLLCFAIAGGLGACSGAKETGMFTTPRGACAPGAEIACACPSGATGVQACRDDGAGYGVCSFCSAADAGSPEAGDPGFIGNPDDLLSMSCRAVEPELKPAFVEIVVDGSGSMASATKWPAAVNVANAFVDALAARRDQTLRSGLMVYGDEKDTTNGSGPYPTRSDVAVAAMDPAQVRAMRDRLTLTQPAGGTPMQKALDGAYAMLEGLGSGSDDAKRVVVLFTDGTVASDADETLVLGTVGEGLGRGVTTMAVGVGPFPVADTYEYDSAFVGEIARAGGAAPRACNPNETKDVAMLCQAQVTPGGGTAKDFAASIDAALTRVRREISACEYSVPRGAVAGRLNVVLVDREGKKSVLRQSGPNGWRLDDPNAPTKVTLLGASCEKLENDRRAGVTFLLECPTAR